MSASTERTGVQCIGLTAKQGRRSKKALSGTVNEKGSVGLACVSRYEIMRSKLVLWRPRVQHKNSTAEKAGGGGDITLNTLHRSSSYHRRSAAAAAAAASH